MQTFNPINVQFAVQDNFYADPDAVRALALAQEFHAGPAYYKGFRTSTRYLLPGIKERFEELLHVKITHWGGDTNGIFQYCPADTPIVYHSDRQTYAAAVYLTPDAPVIAGTNFYRSRATGLRAAPTTLDSIRTGKSPEQLEEETYRNKLYDRTAWELVDQVGNVYNRLAVWNARLLHAAGCYFGNSPVNSRLFQLFFFDAIPKWQIEDVKYIPDLRPPLPPSYGDCTCPPTSNQCTCQSAYLGLG